MTAREMVIRYVSDNSRDFLNFSDEEYDSVVSQAGTSLDAQEPGAAVQAGADHP